MSLAQYDQYTEDLAVLGRWEPGGLLGRDAVAQVRAAANSSAVGLQAVELLKSTWAMLPPDVRQLALGQLQDVGQLIAGQLDDVLGQLEDIPIVNIVAGLVQGFVMVGKGFAGVAEIKRNASNYAHGQAQAYTMQVCGNPNRGFYTRMQVFEYAQYVKVRWGGDFDRKPGFTRRGGERDAIFLGMASPPDTGNCKKAMRRDHNDSYGPFDPKCGRTIGGSALLWPWWSCAYEPAPLLRWAGAPPGASFDPGPSPDVNAMLVEYQTGLMVDPRKNLASSLADVVAKAHRFLSWWDNQGPRIFEIRGGEHEIDTSRPSKTIDDEYNPDHVPKADAGAYWYFDSNGYVRPYEGHQGSSLDAWGKMLPPGTKGTPAKLAVSLKQHNAVLSQRAAFAERRLATLRKPKLVQAIVSEMKLKRLDHGAADAIEYAMASSENLLPYPGERVTQAILRPGRIPPRPVRQVRRPRQAVVQKPGSLAKERPWWPFVLGGLGIAGAVGGAVYVSKRR